MGQELRHRKVPDPQGLWAASGLTEAPEVVARIHADYVAAGARILTTNSYSTTSSRLDRAGLGGRFEELNRLAGELAAEAAAAADHKVWVAGCLPPIGESYRPDLVGAHAEIEPAYRRQAEILAPYVDLFLCETMSSGAEAVAAASGAAHAGKPVWVAWTLEDGGGDRLRSGETVSAAAAMLADLPVSALLLNCSSPESLTRAMPELAGLTALPVGGYANGFQRVPEDWGQRSAIESLGARTDLGPDEYAEHALRWVAAGARLIGGCCEVGPAHIARLREVLA